MEKSIKQNSELSLFFDSKADPVLSPFSGGVLSLNRRPYIKIGLLLAAYIRLVSNSEPLRKRNEESCFLRPFLSTRDSVGGWGVRVFLWFCDTGYNYLNKQIQLQGHRTFESSRGHQRFVNCTQRQRLNLFAVFVCNIKVLFSWSNKVIRHIPCKNLIKVHPYTRQLLTYPWIVSNKYNCTKAER